MNAPHRIYRNAALCDRAIKIIDRVAPQPRTPHGFYDPEGFMRACNASADRNRLYRETVRRLVAKADRREQVK